MTGQPADRGTEEASPAPGGDRLVRTGATCGVAVPVVFVAGVAVADLLWVGYSHRVQNLSDLGGVTAQHPAAANLTFLATGLLIVGFAAALARARRPGAPAALIAAFGLTLTALPVFPCHPGCDRPVYSDSAHVLLAVGGLVLFIVAMFLLARRAPTRAAARYALLTGVGMAASMVLWLVAAEVDPDAWHQGVWQRILVGLALLWVGVTGWRLRRDTRAPGLR